MEVKMIRYENKSFVEAQWIGINCYQSFTMEVQLATLH